MIYVHVCSRILNIQRYVHSLNESVCAPLRVFCGCVNIACVYINISKATLISTYIHMIYIHTFRADVYMMILVSWMPGQDFLTCFATAQYSYTRNFAAMEYSSSNFATFTAIRSSAFLSIERPVTIECTPFEQVVGTENIRSVGIP